MYVILDQMWIEGHSLTVIGKKLGVSKNAVAGKRWRRPHLSPRRPHRNLIPGGGKARKLKPARPVLALVPMEEPVPKKVEPPKPPKPPSKCLWPTEPTGKRGWLSCDAATEPGKVYCPDHCKMAYVRVRDRREDQAA
jgi:GcrA cell cycle regulator